MACVGLALAVPQCVAAAEVNGSLRFSHFTSTRDLDEVASVQAFTVEAEWRPELSENHRLEFKGRATLWGHGDLDETRTHWSSAFWHAGFDRADLRVGQQKVRWGKADGINPTDFFTPVDYSSLLPLEDDRYLSVPAVRGDIHFTDADSLSLVAALGFTPSRIPWPRPSPVQVAHDEPSGHQAGVRWTHTGQQLDWSLSAFQGHATLPLLHYQGADAGPNGAPYVRHYASIRGFGADFARSLGPYGLRAELAYSSPRRQDGRQSIRSSYHLVAGFDRSFSEWNINVQAVVRHTPGYTPIDPGLPAPAQWAAAQNAVVHGQHARWVHGMTARVVADWRHDTVQTELLAVAQFSPDNYLLRPLLTYAVSDRAKLRAGAEIYSGPATTFFGSLERNQTAFVELQLFY